MRAFFLIALLSSPAFAGGPIYGHKDKFVSGEFDQVYHDIKQVPNGIYKTSSMTLQGITVDSITVNHQINGTPGRIIAFNEFVTTTSSSSAGTDWVPSGLKVSLTKQEASSLIEVIATFVGGNDDGTGESTYFALAEDGTLLHDSTYGGARVLNGGSTIRAPVTLMRRLASRAAGAYEYEVYFRVTGGPAGVVGNNSSEVITVKEITQ